MKRVEKAPKSSKPLKARRNSLGTIWQWTQDDPVYRPHWKSVQRGTKIRIFRAESSHTVLIERTGQRRTFSGEYHEKEAFLWAVPRVQMDMLRS